MTYRSIMVAVQVGRKNGGALAVARDLALQFGSHVFGVALCQPIHISYSDAYLVSDLAAQDREIRDREMIAAEAEFRAVMQGRVASLGWHASMTNTDLSRAVADHARGADLVVIGAGRDRSVFDVSSELHAGDLVMQTGRPVFVVPERVERLTLGHVMVAWKDGREARRAVADARPLLAKARRVSLVEIVPGGELAAARCRLTDLAAWLVRHDILAEAVPIASDGDAGARLKLVASDRQVDLIVAGAYAHNRLQEWVVGGVTQTLLMHSDLCCLVAH
jgi:nucleotide-binding universal stress UspA family protein